MSSEILGGVAVEKLLVVAIAETWAADEFSVVAYDLDAKVCKNISIKKNEIWDSARNEIKWDLFGLTYCKTEPLASSYNMFKPVLPPKFIEPYNIKDVHAIFQQRSVSYKSFVQQKFSCAFIRINQVDKIEVAKNTDGKLQSFITINENGNVYRILVKDFRWLHYWNSINQDQQKGKIDYWVRQLNDNNKPLFMVAAHHRIAKEKTTVIRRWIKGLHCFVQDNH